MLKLENDRRALRGKRGLKRFFVLFLLLSVVFSCLLTLGGCQRMNRIDSPVKINYLVDNDITIKRKTVKDDKRFQYSYLQIDGLADKEVQRKINNKLKKEFEGMLSKGLPPYRGIKAQYPNPGKVYSESIDMIECSNFNNILSIMLVKNTTRTLLEGDFDDDTLPFYSHSWYVSDQQGINLDLNTGNEVSLKDLFCDNVDYMKRINDYVAEELNKGSAEDESRDGGAYGFLTLTGPFKGLSESQKFVLYDTGIYLIFDYDTPIFDLDFGSAGMVLNYDKMMPDLALSKRFYDAATNIYAEDKPVVKRLIYGSGQEDLAMRDQKQEGEVKVFRTLISSSSYPKNVQDRMKELYDMGTEGAVELNRRIKTQSLTSGADETEASLEVMVGANVVGHYISVTASYIPYLTGDSDEAQLNATVNETYDAKTGRLMTAKDIFKKGFDYSKALKEGAQKEGLLLYDTITGIGLSNTGLFVSTEKETQAGTLYASGFIPYKRIGSDHLNIF